MLFFLECTDCTCSVSDSADLINNKNDTTIKIVLYHSRSSVFRMLLLSVSFKLIYDSPYLHIWILKEANIRHSRSLILLLKSKAKWPFIIEILWGIFLITDEWWMMDGGIRWPWWHCTFRWFTLGQLFLSTAQLASFIYFYGSIFTIIIHSNKLANYQISNWYFWFAQLQGKLKLFVILFLAK